MKYVLIFASLQMLQGCKEVVILQEDEGMISGDVLASNIPGTTSFAFDPFDASADTPGGPLVGWYGEIKVSRVVSSVIIMICWVSLWYAVVRYVPAAWCTMLYVHV